MERFSLPTCHETQVLLGKCQFWSGAKKIKGVFLADCVGKARWTEETALAGVSNSACLKALAVLCHVESALGDAGQENTGFGYVSSKSR